MLHKRKFEQFKKIASAYDITLKYNLTEKDGGASTDDTIWLYPTSKQWIQEISFWHELGHCIFAKRMQKAGLNSHMSTLSKEGAAWEFGLVLAAKHGRTWNYYSKELKWARKQLASYVHGEYDDLPYKNRKT